MSVCSSYIEYINLHDDETPRAAVDAKRLSVPEAEHLIFWPDDQPAWEDWWWDRATAKMEPEDDLMCDHLKTWDDEYKPGRAPRTSEEREAWLKQREGLITASKVSQQLPSDHSAREKRYSSPYAGKTSFPIPPMQWGSEHEAAGGRLFLQHFSRAVEEAGQHICGHMRPGLVQNPLYPGMGATPDWVVCVCDAQGRSTLWGLELKCPTSRTFRPDDALIPPYIWAQPAFGAAIGGYTKIACGQCFAKGPFVLSMPLEETALATECLESARGEIQRSRAAEAIANLDIHFSRPVRIVDPFAMFADPATKSSTRRSPGAAKKPRTAAPTYDSLLCEVFVYKDNTKINPSCL